MLLFLKLGNGQSIMSKKKMDRVCHNVKLGVITWSKTVSCHNLYIGLALPAKNESYCQKHLLMRGLGTCFSLAFMDAGQYKNSIYQIYVSSSSEGFLHGIP